MIVGKNLTAETAIFCSNFHLPSSIFHHPLFFVFREQGFVDSFDESGEDFAGAAFDEFAGAVLDHVFHRLGPADGTGELGDQVSLDFFLVGLGQSREVLIDRDLCILEVGSMDAFCQFLGGGLHERRMEGTVDHQAFGDFGACGFGLFDGEVDP